MPSLNAVAVLEGVALGRSFIEDAAMKIAVVGAGQWGMNLVQTLHSMGVLGAVVEADSERRASKSSATPGVPWVSSLEDAPPCEAVVIATPAPTHFDVAKAALQSRQDVFVEKPIALSAVQARELRDLAAAQKQVLMVGHLLLYQPAVRWIAGFLKEEGIGKLYSIHQERLNLGRARAAENVLWSLGVHDIAVLLSWVGEPPKKVSAFGQAALQTGIEDDVSLHLSFASDVQAHLHVSWLWPERRRRTTLIGSKGMLVYDELDQTVKLHRKAIQTPALQNIDGGVETVFETSGQEPLRLEMEHFVARCQDRQTPLSGADHALEVTEVLEIASSALLC